MYQISSESPEFFRSYDKKHIGHFYSGYVSWANITGMLSQTPLRGAYSAPQTSSWIWGKAAERERKKRGR